MAAPTEAYRTNSRSEGFVVTIDPASVANAVAPDQTFTLTGTGLKTGTMVHVRMPNLEANLGFCNEHISAYETLKVRFINPTGSPINPASQEIQVIVL